MGRFCYSCEMEAKNAFSHHSSLYWLDNSAETTTFKKHIILELAKLDIKLIEQYLGY